MDLSIIQAAASILGIPALSKGTGKLLETVSDQLALFMEPVHIRRKAAAEADATVYESIAKERVKLIKIDGKVAIEKREDRAAERVRRREQGRQINLESIVSSAAREVPETVSDTPVDEDWSRQFFERCQDVGNEEMQILWGKLLAGEVASPKSFSIQTLAAVQSMSKGDADLFTRFCITIWRMDGKPLCIIPNVKSPLVREKLNLKFDDLMRLESFGLMKYFAEGSPKLLGTDSYTCLSYFDTQYAVSISKSVAVSVGQVYLTDVGRELATIAGGVKDDEYRDATLEGLALVGLRTSPWISGGPARAPEVS